MQLSLLALSKGWCRELMRGGSAWVICRAHVPWYSVFAWPGVRVIARTGRLVGGVTVR